MILCTGTSKGTEPYKVGKRTTDILLEILNLNKTEVISIDIISNQEFTEVINEHFMHVISPFSLFCLPSCQESHEFAICFFGFRKSHKWE